MKYTDPSGHYWFSKVKKNWRTIVTIAVVTVATIATGGFDGVALAGSLGMTTTLGGSILVGAVAGGIGEYFGHSTSFFNPGEKGILNAGMKALSHRVSRAAIARVQGQSARSAFLSGFISSGFSAPRSWGFFGGTMATAISAGTVSELTGGKFANGAISGAFIHMFNDYSDRLANRVAFGDRKPKTAADRIVEKGVQGAMLGAGSGFVRRDLAGALYGGVAGFASGIVKGMSDESHLNINSVSVHGAIKVIIRENLK